MSSPCFISVFNKAGGGGGRCYNAILSDDIWFTNAAQADFFHGMVPANNIGSINQQSSYICKMIKGKKYPPFSASKYIKEQEINKNSWNTFLGNNS